ncbi:meprin A subunit alpha [Latimeria chalumnae]|uniref:Meprin A subunit n=1 Tax=Latimeria chalumnae TaxID=7897 RepID=H3AYK5_LATCH|nr:PREDICTED: meprin A subunit alpha [Latimeria chalumnae]|eukprot:XP_006003740.1 PREDICTED: meprin A subunit alpha [Latimeria chalumnae]
MGSLTLFFLAALVTYSNSFTIRHDPKGTDYDVDAGALSGSIPDINLASKRQLMQGDIALPLERNGLRNDSYRWKFPIPYILSDNLDLNAKGIILRSFEMFRLKSCVDFKPYEGEKTYIIFQKLDGCWSYVGDLQNGQTLSIGNGCDHKSVVEHELLHALGFYHEQSRTDRDDYVHIWWDQIIPGQEHNFVKYDDDYIYDLNTPYDYESLMHYEPFSFNKNDSAPTITAKIPAFNGIIGQRLDFSGIDLQRLNRMYNCTSSLTLLDKCAFEFINICGMIQNEHEDDDWVHVKSVPGKEDHSLAGQCRDAGYYMYFDTKTGSAGQTALLESRILYPKRTQQCLQFFYKMTGSPLDKLVIWIKMDDGAGGVRKMIKVHNFQVDNDHSWKIAHVTLNANAKFRYIFQGVRGNPANSNGGIFLDDISLMETPCPRGVWQIRNFSTILETTDIGDYLSSPRFYSPEGYSYGVLLHPHGPNPSYKNYTGIFFHLISSENDGVLEWPAGNRQVTITVLDQDPDIRLRMSSSRSFTTDKNKLLSDKKTFMWDKPSISGRFDSICNCFRTTSWGWSTLISHSDLHRRSFLKNDDLIVFIDFDDLTPWIKSKVTPAKFNGEPYIQPRQHRAAENGLLGNDPCDPNPCLNEGFCVNINGKADCRRRR